LFNSLHFNRVLIKSSAKIHTFDQSVHNIPAQTIQKCVFS
jgi:hypothetical protein